MIRLSISALPGLPTDNASFSQATNRAMPFACTSRTWKADNRKRLHPMEAGHGRCSSHRTESWPWGLAWTKNIMSSQLTEARLTRSLVSNLEKPSTVGARMNDHSLSTILWDYLSLSRALIPSQEREQSGSRLPSVIPRAWMLLKVSPSRPTKGLSSILTADDSQICTSWKD